MHILTLSFLYSWSRPSWPKWVPTCPRAQTAHLTRLLALLVTMATTTAMGPTRRWRAVFLVWWVYNTDGVIIYLSNFHVNLKYLTVQPEGFLKKIKSLMMCGTCVLRIEIDVGLFFYPILKLLCWVIVCSSVNEQRFCPSFHRLCHCICATSLSCGKWLTWAATSTCRSSETEPEFSWNLCPQVCLHLWSLCCPATLINIILSLDRHMQC